MSLELACGFLKSHGFEASVLDEAMIDYIENTACEQGSEGEPVADELLCSLIPELEQAPNRALVVRDLVKALRARQAPPQAAPEPPALGLAKQAIAAAPEPPSSQGSGVRGGDAAVGSISGHGAPAAEDPPQTELDDPAAQRIAEMFPDAPPAVVCYVLHALYGGDQSAAVQALLERIGDEGKDGGDWGDWPAQAAAWAAVMERAAAEQRAAKERAAKERRRAEKERRRWLLGRFDEQVDDGDRMYAPAPAYGEGKGGKCGKGGKGGGGAMVRFLDGKVVSIKGEKYTVETLKEEWDGGSRGRIKTKGKRGPGWR